MTNKLTKTKRGKLKYIDWRIKWRQIYEWIGKQKWLRTAFMQLISLLIHFGP
jgi:hypothetical protein